MVPCDPVRHLDFEYGKNNWQVPKKSNYAWSNLSKNYTLWAKEQWPFAIRFYEKNGDLDTNTTINFLNLHMRNLNLKKLPDE